MHAFKSLAIWFYTVFGGGLLLASIILTLMHPLKDISELERATGIISEVRHKNYRGDKTYFKLKSIEDSYFLYLVKNKRNKIKNSYLADIWYEPSFDKVHRIKQLKINGELLIEYDYIHWKGIRNKTLTLIGVLSLGFIFLFKKYNTRIFSIKKLLKT
ncbi:hypothetical protein ACFSJY_18690 [Thalassotalea euphylliae]|uniref:hypothetical protein n=1 Tax=Thalassotalea euphylliae TaxID=1655234 RepID=UPI003626C4F7